jgi:hypothetical protein
MTKLQKRNELTDKLVDICPNLLIVGNKNIAVPIDKQPVVKNSEAKIGDMVHIVYDERGYLLELSVTEKGKAKVITEQDKKQIEQNMEQHKKALTQVAEPEKKPEPIKEYISLERRISMHQTTYKECCETARCLMLIPDGAFDVEEYNRLMDIAVTRAKKDAQALLDAAAGDGK